MSGQIVQDLANGRVLFKIDGTIVVSCCNDGWKNGDENGTGAVAWIKRYYDSTKAFWTFEFSDGNKNYIDGKSQ